MFTAPQALGVEQRQVARHHRAPVVAHDHRLGHFQVVEDAHQVAHQVVDVVVERLGAARPAVAPLVGGDGPVAGRGEGRQLVAPRYASSGKPWASSTTGPSRPASSRWRSTPLVDTVRERTSRSGMQGFLRGGEGAEQRLAGGAHRGGQRVVLGVRHHLRHAGHQLDVGRQAGRVTSRFQNRTIARPITGSVAAATNTAAMARPCSDPASPRPTSPGGIGARSSSSAEWYQGSTSPACAAS